MHTLRCNTTPRSTYDSRESHDFTGPDATRYDYGCAVMLRSLQQLYDQVAARHRRRESVTFQVTRRARSGDPGGSGGGGGVVMPHRMFPDHGIVGDVCMSLRFGWAAWNDAAARFLANLEALMRFAANRGDAADA